MADLEVWPAPGPPTHGNPPHDLPSGPVRRFKLNEVILDIDGVFWRCTTAGRPGTWEQLPAAGVAEAVAALVDSAPGTLNTLNELANALGDDANFAATVAAGLVPVGGTTGQLLAKQSNSDRDADWEDAPSGGSGLELSTAAHGSKAIEIEEGGTNLVLMASGTYEGEALIAVGALDDVENEVSPNAYISLSEGYLVFYVNLAGLPGAGAYLRMDNTGFSIGGLSGVDPHVLNHLWNDGGTLKVSTG